MNLEGLMTSGLCKIRLLKKQIVKNGCGILRCLAFLFSGSYIVAVRKVALPKM